jgi:hypothetical protein
MKGLKIFVLIVLIISKVIANHHEREVQHENEYKGLKFLTDGIPTCSHAGEACKEDHDCCPELACSEFHMCR